MSNVLRERGKVGAETRKRVLAAVKELGYQPNLTARALVEGRPPTIALIVSSIANPFYPEFALAAEQAVRKLGYSLLVCNTNDDPAQERAYLDAVGGSLARGVLVMHADFVQLDQLLALRQRGVPVVLCMWEKPDEPPALPCRNSATVIQQIFRFLRKFLQCEHRCVGIDRDTVRQEKSPRALIL